MEKINQPPETLRDLKPDSKLICTGSGGFACLRRQNVPRTHTSDSSSQANIRNLKNDLRPLKIIRGGDQISYSFETTYSF